METILIVDDNKDMQSLLSNILKDEGYKTINTIDGNSAIKEVKKHAPNLVLLDIRLPDMDGIKVLEKMKKIDKDLIIIMLTGYGDVKGAVKAMKSGAYDYLTKPFDNEELIIVIKKGLQSQYLSKEVERLRKRLGEKIAIEEVMGESPEIKQVLKQVNIVAPTNMTVIISGESGTGKELIAQMIYQKSQRKDKPFIAVDCGAIPETLVESELFGYEKGAFTGADAQKEGKFEQANFGTLFLDEITNLKGSAQVKMLRVIQEKKLQHLGGKRDIKVDVRIVVATNTNLSSAVKTGKLRDDLFYRLNEFCIDLPPLRERKEDIPILAKYFLDEANQELNKKIEGISGDVMKLFFNYYWPGNGRELRNVVRKASLLANSNYITLPDISLEDAYLHPMSLNSTTEINVRDEMEKGAGFHKIIKKATEEIEIKAIKEALAKAGGNKTKAAKILKIDRMTLYHRIRKFNLL